MDNCQTPYLMPSISDLLRSKVLNIAIGLLLGGVWGYFGYRHLVAFQAYGQWGHLTYGCIETLIAFFFIFRSTPQTVSTNPLDWLVAFVGSFAPSFFSPATWGILPAATPVLFLGMMLQLLGLLSLNRSFAIVPARRQIKTRGMYAVVRHPLYTSHIIAMTGYVLTNTTASNLIVYAVGVASLFIRLVREEKHLSLDPAYREYMSQVRYRLLPLVY
jgi:protein-S-isoprenylcysteine O-methyltransferase Ste14